MEKVERGGKFADILAHFLNYHYSSFPGRVSVSRMATFMTSNIAILLGCVCVCVRPVLKVSVSKVLKPSSPQASQMDFTRYPFASPFYSLRKCIDVRALWAGVIFYNNQGVLLLSASLKS